MKADATWPALVLISALALGAGWLALRYGLWTDGSPGSGLFPAIACLIILGGSIATALERRGETSDDSFSIAPDRVALAAYVATIIVWPFLLRPLGYALASALAMIALLRAGGVGWVASAAISLLAISGATLLFGVLLEVPLPGPGWR